MAECDAGINLHNEPYPTFENRCGVYLAAGLLLISETLDPRCGLIPGRPLRRVRRALGDVGDLRGADAHSARLP